jgi:Ni/Fe-hydrogenase 1 B-type cytochrome subunit
MATTAIVKAARPYHEELESRQVWGSAVRVAHWMSAGSIVMLLITGFYIAWPFASTQGEASFNFLMGRMRQVHFAFGYVLLAAFLIRIYALFFDNSYARSGAPLFWRKEWWSQIAEQIVDYLRIRVARRHVGHNQLGGLSYVLFVVLLGSGQILTGFAMYSEPNPGGFWDSLVGWIIPLLGGSWALHHWHHLFAWGLLLFIPIHIYVVVLNSVLLENGLISSIFMGRKLVRKGDVDNTSWIS